MIRGADLERLIVGANGGVANTVVYLKNIASGKAFDLSQQRSHVDQNHCRYVPHILLVPEQGTLDMESSDAALHTVHMEGVASFNLPFPVPNRITSRTMPSAGLGHLRCNAGHVWMNAEMLVVRHPYYAVTNESGGFQLTGVPPGTYQIVAWHEGWSAEKRSVSDVLTGNRVDRPVFSDPKTWEKSVTVNPHQVTSVNFVISNQ